VFVSKENSHIFIIPLNLLITRHDHINYGDKLKV